MRLTLTMFLTLDGIYQAPGEPGEDRSDGFEHGGWQVPYVDQDLMEIVVGWFGAGDAFLFGRKTFEIFAGYWPHVTDPTNVVATRLNTHPKYVASGSRLVDEWANSKLIQGDVAREVARLKQQPGDELQMHGSGELAQALMPHGLIDEYRLCFHPVVLSEGKRLFAEGRLRSALRLIDTRTTSTGVMINRYEPVGKPGYGDFGIAELGESAADNFSGAIVDTAAGARRRQEEGGA